MLLTRLPAQNEQQFTIQPIKEDQGVNPQTAAHQAHPGPAIAQNMPAEEGSKEDRQKRQAELNK
jgi:hypothetical protein